MQEKYAKKLCYENMSISALKGVPVPEEAQDILKMIETATDTHFVWDGMQPLYPDWLSKVFFPINDSLFFGKIMPDEFIQQLKEVSAKYWSER